MNVNLLIGLYSLINLILGYLLELISLKLKIRKLLGGSIEISYSIFQIQSYSSLFSVPFLLFFNPLLKISPLTPICDTSFHISLLFLYHKKIWRMFRARTPYM